MSEYSGLTDEYECIVVFVGEYMNTDVGVCKLCTRLFDDCAEF